MTPLSLLIENFGPFKGKPTNFEFPRGPGLFFLWGDNRAEPRLEGNGAGKSSVWNALTWVLFGKTTRGLRAGDAANWDVSKGTSVQLEFSDPTLTGGMPAFVKRTWSPNSWTYQDLFSKKPIDLAADETNPITEALRLSFSAFLNSVLMAQGQPMFLDLKPEAKAALFSDVMGLEKWVERSKKASTIAGHWDDELRKCERELSNIDGQLQAMSTDNHIMDEAHAWDVTQREKREALRVAYEAHLAAEQALKVAIGKAHEACDRAWAAAEATLRPWHDAEAAVQASQKALHDARKQRDEARGAVDAMDRSIAFLEAYDKCPTCGQDTPGVNHGHLVERDMTVDEFVNLDKAVLALEDEHARLETWARETAARKNDAKAALTDDEAAERELKRKLSNVGADLDDLEARDDALADEVNPWSDVLKRRQRDRAALQIAHGQALRLVEFADSQRALYGYWVKWHKEIRLQLIADALFQLEIEVNAEAQALGLIGWELRFDVDREGKGGNVQRGFLTTVLSPHNDRPVPWEAWSGGESQRLRAAAQMGLSNLIRRRTGATMPLEVWDEPTQWLSPQGVEDLLVALGERAQREQLQIWVVDHRSLGHGGFTAQVGAIKEADTGTRFVKGTYNSGHGDIQRTSERKVVDRARARLTTIANSGTLDLEPGLAFGRGGRAFHH